jgi:hypothetical protein
MGCWLDELGLVSWRALHPTRRAPLARGDLPSDKGRLGKKTRPTDSSEVVFGADGWDV